MAIFKGGRNRDDSFTGTAEADRFEFAPADLNRDDTIVGGTGIDTLVFTARGKISAAALANVSGIERIDLASGGTAIEITQQLAQTGADGRLTVVGGDGNDTIDASAIFEADAPDGEEATAPVTLLGGAGDDVLLGGADGRLVFDGGEGHDTITGVNGAVVYDGADRSASLSGGGVLRVTGAATIDLTRDTDQSLGDRCVVSGFYAVDASTSLEGIDVIAERWQSVTGGKGADRIVGATTITGGRGADTLIGSATDTTVFYVNRGDFVRGDSIIGQSESNIVATNGTVDLTKGTIKGVSQVSVGPADDGQSGVATITAAQAMGLTYVQGAGELVIELGRARMLDLRSLHDRSAGAVAVTVHGSASADVIDGYEANSFDAPGLRLSVEGGDGDDVITGNADAVRLDGGAGTDTFKVGRATEAIEIDLSHAGRQGIAGVGLLSGFENINLATGTTASATVHGSAGANVITGTFGRSTIFGEAGDDTLSGGNSFGASATLNGGLGDDILLGTGDNAHATMTGGRGADTFRWAFRGTWDIFDDLDTVTDFKSGEDHLQFARTQFEFSGDAFDTRIVAKTIKTDLTGADLVIYTGGTLNGIDDVENYIGTAKNGSGADVFIAGSDDAGHTVLYHSLAGSVTAIADLGETKLTSLALTDFSFI